MVDTLAVLFALAALWLFATVVLKGFDVFERDDHLGNAATMVVCILLGGMLAACAGLGL